MYSCNLGYQLEVVVCPLEASDEDRPCRVSSQQSRLSREWHIRQRAQRRDKMVHGVHRMPHAHAHGKGRINDGPGPRMNKLVL